MKGSTGLYHLNDNKKQRKIKKIQEGCTALNCTAPMQVDSKYSITAHP